MSRVTRKGRSKDGGKFVQLHDWMLSSAAWHALSPAERCVYIEIVRVYDGKNNGFLGLGERRAADLCNISKNTAPLCFRRLMDLGFIERVVPGGFNLKTRHQTEWRLTAHQCNRTGTPGSRAFMKWRPEEKTRPQMRDTTAPNEGQSGSEKRSTVPELGPSARIAAA